MTTQMNNVIVTHRGWTISITDHKGFDPHGSNRKTREIGIWDTADIEFEINVVVYHYGDSAKELVHAIRYAQWQIDKTLFKSWIKSTLRLGA